MAHESIDDRLADERFRQIAEALAAAEAKYRRLFEDSLTGIAMLNPAGIIVECNGALSRMLAADDVVGQPLAAFADDQSYVKELLELVRTEGRVESAELHGRRADGEAIVMAARFVGTFDPPGHVASVQLLAAEMTDRKRLEAHLIGIQRTEAIGRLAGGLAHDFNNLLTVIGGHSDYLLETLPDGDPRRSSAQSIHQASHRAAALTRQLLAFGRRQVFHLRVVDIHQLLDDAQPMLARALGERIQLHVEVGATSPNIHADPAQVEQILVNLALHARDALPDGGTLRVRVSLMKMDQRPPERPWIRARAYLRIDVTDSGPAMDELVRARVFEPFFTTKYLGRGNGLGLATVYGIVKQSDGYIWVDSEVGRGTTFTVLFPALTPAEPEAASASRPDDIRPHEAVLILEQEDGLRALIADAMRRRGYHVLDTDSETRAAELFDAHAGRIDLLVSDVREMSAGGPALAERLRAVAPRLRIVYMSAPGTAAPSSPAAGVEFIQKPFSLHAFADKVRQILDTGSGDV